MNDDVGRDKVFRIQVAPGLPLRKNTHFDETLLDSLQRAAILKVIHQLLDIRLHISQCLFELFVLGAKRGVCIVQQRRV